MTAQAVIFHSLSGQALHGIHCAGKIPRRGGIGDLKKIVQPHKPGRFADGLHGDIMGVCPAKIKERKGITHTAIGNAGNESRGFFRQGHVLLPGNEKQPIPDDLRRNTLKIKPLAAGLNGSRDLVHLGGSQNENHMLRRLFHDLEQGIDRPDGKHMRLIDNINAVFGDIGQKNGFLPQVTDIIHAVIAGGINLHYIHQAAVIHAAAAVTLAAGAAIHRVAAVHRLGDELGAGGFAGATAAHQQISMGRLSLNHLVLQRGGDMLLPHHFLKGAGTPLAVKCLIHSVFPSPTIIKDSLYHTEIRLAAAPANTA